jgi:hypothetical protein
MATSCGAADEVSDATERAAEEAQKLEYRRICVADEDALCPAADKARDLLVLATDDCYDLVSIESGPDAACCFGVHLELSLDQAVDCL